MDILIGVLLLLAVIFFVLGWWVEAYRLHGVALGCTILAVVLVQFGDRLRQ